MLVRAAAALTLFLSRSPAPDPHALVAGAITALRHAAPPSAAESIRLTGIGHTWVLGNAERAEGPWRASYASFSELIDLAAGRMRRAARPLAADGSPAPEQLTVLADSVAVLLANGRYAGGSRGTFEDFVDRVDGSPYRALQLARASAHLVLDAPVDRSGVVHDVVSFPWRNGRMRIEISRETHLPDAVVIVRPYPDNFRWAPFGDVTMRTENVDWEVTPAGAYWPMQQKVFFNGEPLRDATYERADFGVAVPPDSFAVSDSARRQFAAASQLNFSRFRIGMRGHPSELEPGIVRVPDFWTQTLVEQPDGVVLFEAHISARYLHDVIGEANRRWPGARIKALVMTSDPWAHLGGVREAMALGIPIYVQANSIPFLRRLAAAPHLLAPDSLARSHRAPRLIGVTGKTVIGTGDNQIELYPVRGPYAERMLMAYFPGRRLLYGADLVFPNTGADGKPAPGFAETEAIDLRNAVARERLDVDTVFCVQNDGPFAWSDFVDGLRIAALPTLAPGSALLSTARLDAAHEDHVERQRHFTRSVTGDTTERASGEKIVDERHVVVRGRRVLRVATTGHYPDPRNAFVDTMDLRAADLAPVREHLAYPNRGTGKVIAYAGDHLTQTNVFPDSAHALARRFPVRAFAFSEVDLVVRSLPLRTGFAALVPLYSEGDDSLETDTVRVLGPRDEGRVWSIRFADPAIIVTYGIAADTRAIVGYDVSSRRYPNLRLRRTTERSGP